MSDVATIQTTPAIRAYLRRATWGLPRARQQEVWDELEEHLLFRAAQFQTAGLAPPEALNRALAELGSPARINAGMTGVYLMPKLVLIVGAGAVALSATLYAWAGGSQGPTDIPTFGGNLAPPICIKGTVPHATAVTIVSSSPVDGITCYVPKKDDAAPRVLSPGAFVSDQTLIGLAKSLGIAAAVNEDGFIVFSRSGKEFMSWRAEGISNGMPYFPASLAGRLITSDTSARLSGFGPILIATPKAQYSLDVPSPSLFYKNATLGFVELGAGQETDVSGVATHQHQIQTQLPVGEVVMLLTRTGKKYTADYAPVGPNGVVKIKSNQPHLNFMTQPNQLTSTVSAGRVRAVLVQVTNIPLNNLKSGIFLPKQATSDAQTAQQP